ncbi:MAG: hypothetical protein ACT4O9_15050 [Blastocatellia bacterium]
MIQAKLFEATNEAVEIETVLLCALGDFQSRGKVLADRELALDRLHGAFLRAFAKFGITELSYEQIVEGLRNLGVIVTEIPSFVAKRPFRIIVSTQLAKSSRDLFQERQYSD